VRVLLARLHENLADFRASRGFGRAISAPQLGRRVRLVAFDLGRGPRALINPRIVAQSDETFTLWDDCLCFPDLLVRVRRARSITIEFDDERGHPQTWKDLQPAESELFQHELDHLDGVLMTERMDPDTKRLALKEIRRIRDQVEVAPRETSGFFS
jgi:peptide deformylase